MLAKVDSACLIGMDASIVQVEVSLAKGLPCFSIVGLPDAAVRESKDRVVAAIRNTGFEFPSRRVTVNLAPADVKKEGASFDLAIAVGILLASEAIQPSLWPRCIWLGELALDGAIRPVRGALPIIHSLCNGNSRAFVIPEQNLAEVAFLKKATLHSFCTLGDVVSWLHGDIEVPPYRAPLYWKAHPESATVDLCDVKGQALAKRALEIAAAGNHNLILSGSPGTGKSMLANALPGIMPEWTLDESLDASRVHSIAGETLRKGLLAARPFRNPHHSISSAALIGGGDLPMPGEVSLAHRGILFLDELPEFRRDSLEALRQPMEEGVTRIHRARGRATYPAQFLLIAAMNPCPCGNWGNPKKECVCSPHRIQKYRNKISAPLLDRIDLQVELPSLKVDELFSSQTFPENSTTVRERVTQARQTQAQRCQRGKHVHCTNAQLKGAQLRRYAELDSPCKDLLKSAVEKLGLSARAFDRIRRVSRTIADLEGSEKIKSAHVAESIQYRAFDKERPLW